MRPTPLLACAALFAITGCIEEPQRVVPVGGFHESADHGGSHEAMGHDGEDHAGMGHGEASTTATARIAALGGSGVSGTVTFTELSERQLRVEYALSGLEPGEHGFHVHENGSCAASDDGTPGGAAGGHFNPDGHPHGGMEAGADARHAGDFGNIVATATGIASGSFTDTVARLRGTSGIMGKALMVHADADDLQSQPSGAAGARVGCGIIGS